MTDSHINVETLVEYLHGELSAERDAAVHLHLTQCAACTEAYEAEARLTDLLRSHARGSERDVPVSLVHDIRAATLHAAPSPRRPWWHAAIVTAAIVAGFAIGAFATMGGWHSRARASSIDAAYYLDDHAAAASSEPITDAAALPIPLTSDSTQSDERPADAPR